MSQTMRGLRDTERTEGNEGTEGTELRGGSGGTGGAGDGAEVVLADIRDSPLSVDEVLDAVRHSRAGGVASFIGVVREQDHGRSIQALEYTSHPAATEVLGEVARRVAAGADVIRIGVAHRVGRLEVGDIAVVVAVSAAHRGAALDVCRELIDAVKDSVPIWKHQIFADGSDEWVGTP